MYLSVVFVILFQISMGLHLNFGLAQLLHDLSSGKAELFNIGNSKDSKSTESKEDVKGDAASSSKNSSSSGLLNLKTSIKVDGSKLEDSLKDASGKATEEVLENALKKVGEKSTKVLKGTSEILSKNSGEASNSSLLESSLGSIYSKVGKVLEGDKSEDSLKAEKTGKVSSSNILETVSGKVDETINTSNLQSSVKSVQDKAAETLGESLKTVSGKADKTVDVSILEDSLSALEGTLETVSEKGEKPSDPSNLQGTVKALQEKAGEVLQDSAIESVSESVSSKEGGILDIPKDSVKALPKNAGKVVPSSTLKGTLEIGSEKESKSLSSGVLGDAVKSISATAEKSLDTSSLKDPIKDLKKEGKSLQGSTLEDSMEMVSAEARKTIDGGDMAGSLQTISKKPQKMLQGSQLDVHLGTTVDRAGKFSSGISLEDPLGKVADRVKKALTGSTSVKAQAIESIGGTLKDGIPEKVMGISHNVDINPEISIGCVTTGLVNVPAIATFIKACHKGVLSSKLLIILFNITDATAMQFTRFKYRFFADVFRKLGFIDGNEIATLGMRHVAKYFEIIPPDVLVKVYTSSFAFFLFSEGILTDNNAEKLALAWINSLTETSEAYDVICDCDFNRKFHAAAEGNSNFLFSVVEMTKSKAWAMAFYYQHAWLTVAADRGNLKVLSVN